MEHKTTASTNMIIQVTVPAEAVCQELCKFGSGETDGIGSFLKCNERMTA